MEKRKHEIVCKRGIKRRALVACHDHIIALQDRRDEGRKPLRLNADRSSLNDSTGSGAKPSSRLEYASNRCALSRDTFIGCQQFDNVFGHIGVLQMLGGIV